MGPNQRKPPRLQAHGRAFGASWFRLFSGSRCSSWLEAGYPDRSGVTLNGNHSAVVEQAPGLIGKEGSSWAAYILSPALISGSGDSREAALDDLRRGITLWVEDLQDQGLTLPACATEFGSIEVAA